MYTKKVKSINSIGVSEKASYKSQTKLSKRDKEFLADKGIKIVSNHSRFFASAEINGNVISFQIQYIDANGDINKKMPDGTFQKASEYTARQISDIVRGDPIVVDRVTTSGVIYQNEVQMLQKGLSKFGKLYYTVAGVDSAFLNGDIDKNRTLFSDKKYETAAKLSATLMTRTIK